MLGTKELRAPLHRGAQRLQDPWSSWEPSTSAFFHPRDPQDQSRYSVWVPEGETRAVPGPSSNSRGSPRAAEKRSPIPDSAALVRPSPRGLTGPRCVLTVVAMVLRRLCASPTARRPTGRALLPPLQPASPTVVPRGNLRLSQLTVAPPRPTPAFPKRRRFAMAGPAPSGSFAHA